MSVTRAASRSLLSWLKARLLQPELAHSGFCGQITKAGSIDFSDIGVNCFFGRPYLVYGYN
jgi:hypothetical protein